MSDELNESQDTLNLDEETIQETEIESSNSEEDIESLKAKAAKADEYKKYADRVTAENRELKKDLKPKETLTIKQSSSDPDRDLLVDLRLEGYSKSEAEFILRNGGRAALEDPLVTGAIESARKKAKSQEATPSGTNKSTVYQKYTETDLKAMPLDQLEKIVPQ